jgi:CRP-like cAMP-binding protein
MQLRHNAKIDLIKRVPLFAACSKRDLDEVAKLADEIDLPAGKAFIREGDQGREFFAIVEGTAEVRRGKDRIATIGPGDFVGEMALVTKAPRNATVTATSPVRALVIEGRAFRGLLDHSPQIQLRILQALAERLAAQSV